MLGRFSGLLSTGICALALGACSDDNDPSPPPLTGGGGTSSAGGSGGGGSGGSGGNAGQSPTIAWDYTGIIGTGQSLSVGAQAGNITLAATMQPYGNLKLSLGGVTVPPFDDTAAALTLVPLVEPIRPTATGYPSAYPANLYGESPHTAMSAALTALAKAGGAADLVSVHTVVGENGQGMEWINKAATEMVVGTQTQGRAYAASLFEVRAIDRLAEAAGKTYGVGGIFLTHGESDAGEATYGDQMFQLWTDYNADIKAVTGQTESIPLFTSQQHGIYMYALGNAPRNIDTSTRLQWTASVDHPEAIVCVGPKYQYPYFSDYLHLVPLGYELMGEKYAQAYYQHVVEGRPWKPLAPLPATVARAGNTITVDFEVPVPPLAWDDALPQPHTTDLVEWAQGRGFEVRSGATRLTIESVALVDADTVSITVTGEVPAGATLGYAATAGGDAVVNFSPRKGQLKDSDPFVGDFTKMAQPNYAVAFELPVP
jgi:hypothetical protein